MSCTFSKDTLARHVEGELPKATAEATSQHLERCEDCRRFFEQLQTSQSMLRSLRRETVSPFECTGMRHEVMSIVNRQHWLGWALRVERAAMLAFRQHAYAVAACAIVGIVSASVLAQMRQAPTSDVKNSAAVFEGADTLLRPDDYREWILVGDDSERRPAEGEGVRAELTPAHRVYIDPESYRAYMKTGGFSEGTVMVWESVRADADATRHPHPQSPALLASVKDSTRFDGGWGFFDFTGQDGRVISKAQPNAESSRCRTCHLEEAETDSVFTQFYSALRSARQGQEWDERRPQPTLAHS